MSNQFKGSLMVIIAGIAWGISGVSGQYLMSHGVHVNLLTSLRLILSGVLLTGTVLLAQRDKLLAVLRDKKSLLAIALFALCGLLMNQYAYLSAIHHTNAGTATVLQYVTPVLILAYVCLRQRKLPTWVEVVAIVMAIAGTFVIATHGQVTELAITPLGLFWGLLSAVTYSLYILLPVKQIERWGSLLVIGLGMLMGGLVFPLVTQVWQYDLPLTPSNLLALFGLVIIGTVFAYTVFLKGTTLVGAVKGSLLASIEPIASVILTVLIMGDHFFAIDVLGMVLIVLAVVLISLQDLLALKKEEKLKP